MDRTPRMTGRNRRRVLHACTALGVAAGGAFAQPQTFSAADGTLHAAFRDVASERSFEGPFDFTSVQTGPQVSATAGTTNNRCCAFAGLAEVRGVITLTLYVDPATGLARSAALGGQAAPTLPDGATLLNFGCRAQTFQGSVINPNLYASVVLVGTAIGVGGTSDPENSERAEWGIPPGPTEVDFLVHAEAGPPALISGSASASLGVLSGIVIVTPGRVGGCRVDFNADGDLNADDLSDYITCYFSFPTCTIAEFNGDGDLNADDLSDFITAYFAGC